MPKIAYKARRLLLTLTAPAVCSEQFQDISPDPVDNSGHPRQRTAAPVQLDLADDAVPHDPDSLYVASEAVWKTTDHGKSWKIISGDLTRNDKSKQTASGGPLTKDITSVEYYDTISPWRRARCARGCCG